MSSCVCAYVYPDNPAEFVSERVVVAKKKHKCSECRREISIGEPYEYTFGVWDGDPGVYKTCNDCLSVRSVFFCDGWQYERVWDLTYETLNESSIPLGQLDALTPSAREKVIAYIDEELDL
jgi:hypothetical protein